MFPQGIPSETPKIMERTRFLYKNVHVFFVCERNWVKATAENLNAYFFALAKFEK